MDPTTETMVIQPLEYCSKRINGDNNDRDISGFTSACFIFLLKKQLSVLQNLGNMGGDMS